MKTSVTLKLGLAAAVLSAGIALAPAAEPSFIPVPDRYHINVSMSGKTTNEVLALVSHPLRKSSVLKNISESTSIPVSNLAMILERESGLILVVDREFGTNVFPLIRLETDLSLSNTNLTKGEVFMKVHHATQENFDGSAVATITIRRNALQEETSFKMTGKIHVAVEATETDRTEIYSGVFSTGAVFTPRQVLQ